MRKRLFKKGVREGKKSGGQAPLSHLNASDSWRMLESRHMRGMWEQRGGGKQDGCQSGASGQLTFHVFGWGLSVAARHVTGLPRFHVQLWKRKREILWLPGLSWSEITGEKGWDGESRRHIIRQTLSTISENVSEYIKLFSKMIFVSGLVLFTFVKQKNKISQTYLVCLRVRKTLLTVFVISVLCFSFSFCRSSVGSALPRRRCCAYITIGMICIFIGVGLTVSTISVSVWVLVHKNMLSKLKPQSASQRKRLARINQEEEQQSRSDKGERTYRNARCTLWHSYHGDV